MKVLTANMGVEEIFRALDLAAYEEWEDAKAALDGLDDPVAVPLRAFFTRMLARDRERTDALSARRHELANAISIALANLEGMVDGAVAINPARLNNVCEALRRARGLLDRLRGDERNGTEEQDDVRSE
jgi:hypothetical protein